MSFTYSWSTSPLIAQVRLMVGDTVDDPPTQPAIFQDDEIMGVLQVNSSQNIIVGLSGYSPAVPVAQVYSFGRTAAMLLQGLGATRARSLLRKVLDVEVDPRAATAALKDLGQSYIDQEVSNGYFAVAEMGINQFWFRERLQAQLLRQVA